MGIDKTKKEDFLREYFKDNFDWYVENEYNSINKELISSLAANDADASIEITPNVVIDDIGVLYCSGSYYIFNGHRLKCFDFLLPESYQDFKALLDIFLKGFIDD
jgi:hypothetical protein